MYLKLNESNVSSNFLEFLNSLGWPVSVSSHAGWTGHVQTSWRSATSAAFGSSNANAAVHQPDEDEHGGALYNGSSHVLYWADVSSEVAFVVPTLSANVTSDPLPIADSNFSEPSNGKYLLFYLKNQMKN